MSADWRMLSRFVPPKILTERLGQISPAVKAALDAINQKVAAAESLEHVMDFLFEATREIFPCDRVSIAFLEDRGQRLVSRWTRAHYEPVLLKLGYAEGLAGSSLERVINTGAPRIIDDLEAYLAAKPESTSTALLVKEGVRSSMTCPLLVEGRVAGLLFRSSRQAHAYDEYQVMLHSQVAERLGQAVEKAYRIDQLTAANHAYMELLGFAAHELKSPAASIIMDAELLTKGYLGPLEERQVKKIEGIIDKAKGLLSTTREYLDLAKLEGGQLKLRPRRGVRLLAEVIQPVLDTLAPQMEARGNTLRLPPGSGAFEVDCDPDLMKTVLLNLLGNAVKYGKAGAEIRLQAEKKGERLRVSVWNEGPGFPPSESARLFKRFSRLSLPEHKGIRGTGVGLYLVWQIVQLHGGRVWARSKYGEWAEFLLEIPL